MKVEVEQLSLKAAAKLFKSVRLFLEYVTKINDTSSSKENSEDAESSPKTNIIYLLKEVIVLSL